MNYLESSINNNKKAKILLVDDDADQLIVLSALLNQENYEVISAQSGEAALTQLEGRSFDAVITDVCMPKMSGLELAKLLRKVDGHQTTPIVLMTAGSEPIDFQSHKFRADAFCLKKNLKQSLLSALNSLV